MSEKRKTDHNLEEDRSPSPEETVDGPSGLKRLAELARRTVRVPKTEVEDQEEEKT